MKSKKENESEEIRITIRIPFNVHAKLQVEAKKRRRSLNQQIVYSLELGLGEVKENGDK